jgi:hypothetical protein
MHTYIDTDKRIRAYIRTYTYLIYIYIYIYTYILPRINHHVYINVYMYTHRRTYNMVCCQECMHMWICIQRVWMHVVFGYTQQCSWRWTSHQCMYADMCVTAYKYTQALFGHVVLLTYLLQCSWVKQGQARSGMIKCQHCAYSSLHTQILFCIHQHCSYVFIALRIYMYVCHHCAYSNLHMWAQNIYEKYIRVCKPPKRMPTKTRHTATCTRERHACVCTT